MKNKNLNLNLNLNATWHIHILYTMLAVAGCLGPSVSGAIIYCSTQKWPG